MRISLRKRRYQLAHLSRTDKAQKSSSEVTHIFMSAASVGTHDFPFLVDGRFPRRKGKSQISTFKKNSVTGPIGHRTSQHYAISGNYVGQFCMVSKDSRSLAFIDLAALRLDIAWHNVAWLRKGASWERSNRRHFPIFQLSASSSFEPGFRESTPQDSAGFNVLVNWSTLGLGV